MPKTILICMKNQDLSFEVARLVEEELAEISEEIFTIRRPDKKEAQKILAKKKIDLVITDFRSPVASDKNEVKKGTALLAAMKDQGREIPSILITHVPASRIYDMTHTFYKCRVIIQDQEFESLLKEYSTVLLKEPQRKSEPAPEILQDIARIKALQKEKVPALPPLMEAALVEFYVGFDQKLWTYRMIGVKEKKIEKIGVLNIKLETLDQLLKKSIGIEKGVNDFSAEKEVDTKKKQAWKKELQEVGTALYEEIFINNPQFAMEFSILEGAMGGRSNIRFCFRFEKEFHSVHFEAVFDGNKNKAPHYLVLTSPVYRTLNLTEPANTLVFDRQGRRDKINCLLIKSNVDESFSGIKKRFKRLTGVDDEIDQIYEIFKTHQTRFNIGCIRVLDLGSDQPETEDWKPVKKDFADYVEQTLKTPWHIIHYAGHSYYNGDEGYLIFPKTKDEYYPVRFGRFSSWLRTSETQLLFLCSCCSSAENIVFDLAKNSVPAILGFRWDLSDRHALEYAPTFYKHLVEKQESVESAFQHTTFSIYDGHKEDPIWASPMLVKQ